MKTFYVGSAKFFEFECDEHLVNELLTQIEKQDYMVSYHVDGDDANYCELGYEKKDNYNTSLSNEKLYNFFNYCLDKVWSSYCNDKIFQSKLKICDLWVVKSQFSQIARPHTHSLSLFSGLLYLTTCTKSETVFFSNDEFYENWKEFFGRESLLDNKIQEKIKPVKGKLIIWPSSILHKINPHKEKEPRYTISFNSFVEMDSKKISGRLKTTVGDPTNEKFLLPKYSKKGL